MFTSFPIVSDIPMSEAYAILNDVSHGELIALADYGFPLFIKSGRIQLTTTDEFPAEAFCKLIATEVMYLDEDETTADYLELHEVDVFNNWQVEWVMPYIKQDKTLDEIVADIRMDWSLSDEDYIKLKSKRAKEYQDDDANFPNQVGAA